MIREEDAIITRNTAEPDQPPPIRPRLLFDLLPLDNSQIYDIFCYLLSEYFDTPDLAPIYWTSRQHQKATHELLVRRSAQAKWTFPVTGLTYYRCRSQCRKCKLGFNHYVHGLRVPSLPLTDTLILWWTKEVRRPRREDLLAAIQVGNQRAVDVMMGHMNAHVFVDLVAKKAVKYGQADMVLRFLGQDYGVGQMVRWAVKAGQFEVLKKIHIHRETLLTTMPSLPEAGRSGNLEMIQWMMQNGLRVLSAEFVKEAACKGHVHLLEWMVRGVRRLSIR